MLRRGAMAVVEANEARARRNHMQENAVVWSKSCDAQRSGAENTRAVCVRVRVRVRACMQAFVRACFCVCLYVYVCASVCVCARGWQCVRVTM
jgi:hypothetical protein